MSNNHGLRTTGRHTGNFGKAKVQGKRETLDLSSETLKRDNLRIPEPDKAYSLMQKAYEMTTDPKLKVFLKEQLRARNATRINPNSYAKETPRRDYWEEVKRVR